MRNFEHLTDLSNLSIAVIETRRLRDNLSPSVSLRFARQWVNEVVAARTDVVVAPVAAKYASTTLGGADHLQK